MKSRERTSSLSPSLFPFLSVLVCFIGVLVFLVAAVAPASLQNAQDNAEIVVEEGPDSKGENVKLPVFVDCTAYMGKALDGGSQFSISGEEGVLAQVLLLDQFGATPSFDFFRGTPFTDFLAALAGEAGEKYVVFLVRPDGQDSFFTLEQIIRGRNRALPENGVNFPAEDKTEIPRSLAWKGASIRDGRLYFRGRMGGKIRDALKAVFSKAASQSAVDELYRLTQSAPRSIDFGNELISKDWTIRGFRKGKVRQKFDSPML